MALLKDSRFSVRMAYVMRTENQSNGRAHGCDHAQIFCAHGLIHAHRKSRIIGVRMATCTSKPIIGKDAPRYGAGPSRRCSQLGIRGLSEDEKQGLTDYHNRSTGYKDQEEIKKSEGSDQTWQAAGRINPLPEI